MFFRFGVGLLLVVLTSLGGTALEKRNLELKRAVSRQHYRLERLQEQRAGKRVLAQQLGAPNRLVGQVDQPLIPDQGAKSAKPARPNNRKPRNNSQASRDGSP
ncbi:MAG: hypothetical protein HY290_13155 [Planctomycetia bacterium]|nr:hypothetical protein [Planctomycetia bacterium]